MFKFTVTDESGAMGVTAEFKGNAVEAMASYATTIEAAINAMKDCVKKNCDGTVAKELFVAAIEAMFKDVTDDAHSLAEKLYDKKPFQVPDKPKEKTKEDDAIDALIELLKFFK